MKDPIDHLIFQECKTIDLSSDPASVLAALSAKNPLLDLPLELHADFLVVDARKYSAEDINAWIRKYMEAEKDYPDIAPQIGIIGQIVVDAIKLPDFDADEYDDYMRWDYVQTQDLATDVAKIYRDQIRHDLTQFTSGDPARGLSKLPDPDFRPVEEFMSGPQEIADFRERVRKNQRGNRENAEDDLQPR